MVWLTRRTLAICALSWAGCAASISSALADDPPAAAVPADPGRATTGAAADAKQVWIRQVIGRIQTARARHPAKVRYDGRVLISFTVGWDGHLLDSKISSTSGQGALDREALAILRDAAPFPPVPSSLASDKITLSVPIHFVRSAPAPSKSAGQKTAPRE